MRLRAFGAAAVGLLAIGGWLWISGDGIQQQRGSQIESPEVRVGDAESHRWSALINEDGTSRPEFPGPLVAQDALLCFGFERLDFGGPPRPSVARCIEREALRSLEENSLASVFVIKAGLDTWHLIATLAPVDAVDIAYADNTKLSADRIFIGDAVIALRLPNENQIETMSWTRGRSRYRCDPPPDAVQSGNFCR